MKTLTLEVRSPEEGMDEFVQAWRSGKAQRAARISFATPELLWKVLSAKRWELLKALCGAGPVSIREAARRAPRAARRQGRLRRHHGPAGGVVRAYGPRPRARRCRFRICASGRLPFNCRSIPSLSWLRSACTASTWP